MMKKTRIPPIGIVGECSTSDITYSDCCLLARTVISQICYQKKI